MRGHQAFKDAVELRTGQWAENWVWACVRGRQWGVRLPETSVEGVQAAQGKQGRHCNAPMIGVGLPRDAGT